MSRYHEFSRRYNSIELFKIIASMQLLPGNHGKNVRLEEVSKEKSCGTELALLDLGSPS